MRSHSFWLRIVLPGLLVLGLAGAVWTETASAPALPEGVAPLSAETAKRFEDLLAAAEKYRGLEARQPIAAGTLEEAELRKKMAESLEEDLSPEQLKAVEIGAKAFGLIPESLDLAHYLPELLTAEVAGFYDPQRHYLALVRRDPSKHPQGGLDANDVTLVHELTHALQDQHFNLRTFEEIDPMSDASTARSALAEGDATLTMTSFLAGMNVEDSSGIIGKAVKSFFDSPGGGTSSDMPGSAELSAAPAWIRDSLLFPYVEGLSFCMEVRRLGGQKLLDYAFTKDPPRSSEQILHPAKWHGRRDDPVVLRLPDLAAALPEWRKVSEGELGEAGIQTLLRETARSRDEAAAAAAGWGGDRFAVYEKQGKRVLVWWTEWDSEAEAREFQAAAGRLGGGWQLEKLTPTRVLVMRGALTRRQRTSVRGRLAAAETIAPANEAIDLKALGVVERAP